MNPLKGNLAPASRSMAGFWGTQDAQESEVVQVVRLSEVATRIRGRTDPSTLRAVQLCG